MMMVVDGPDYRYGNNPPTEQCKVFHVEIIHCSNLELNMMMMMILLLMLFELRLERESVLFVGCCNWYTQYTIDKPKRRGMRASC